nr:hypothetical protein [Tanacetum cinerariifolium]
LTDGGDDDDDEEESSEDDEDDDMDIEADEEEEEEYPAPADSVVSPPPSPIRSLGYQAAMIRLRDEAAFTSSPPLQLPSASRRDDRPEFTLPPQKRLGIALGPRYEVGESSSAAARPPG